MIKYLSQTRQVLVERDRVRGQYSIQVKKRSEISLYNLHECTYAINLLIGIHAEETA